MVGILPGVTKMYGKYLSVTIVIGELNLVNGTYDAEFLVMILPGIHYFFLVYSMERIHAFQLTST